MEMAILLLAHQIIQAEVVILLRILLEAAFKTKTPLEVKIKAKKGIKAQLSM